VSSAAPAIASRMRGRRLGARRTMPPTGWLRASPCPPAKRVVIPTFRLKSGIFKPVVFNPFQTDADNLRRNPRPFKSNDRLYPPFIST
jgi:hypothetical protein